MAKACEICHQKIGFFDSKYVTTDDKTICQWCFSKYEIAVPFVLDRAPVSITEIVQKTDSPEVLAYCKEHGLLNLPEERRKAEAEIEAQRKKRIDLAKRQLILSFSVSGMKYHDIRKAVAFAKKEKMFIPFDGLNAADLKDDPYEKTYEADLSSISSGVEFKPEPDNKYDSNAIKFYIEIKDKKFMIGYVPKKVNIKMGEFLKEFHEGKIAMGVSINFSGGKFKEADDDPNDFSDDPKLKIYTGVDDYKCHVEISDKNRK